MNVKSKETKENSTVELVIEVGAAEFEAGLDKVYKKNRNSIAVPGFRKGKAPRKIIEAMYGSGVFYEDAIDELYPAAYTEAVEKEGLNPVAYPEVEVMEVGKEGFTFKALVTVKPAAKIGKYQGLSAVKEDVSVTDKDVEDELKPFIQRATRLVTVEREAKKGDTVLLDFEGFDDGVPFAGGKAENYTLELGSGSFIPGFEDQVAGMKAGDEKDINVTFPEDYSPELAGKSVVFKIKLHEVKEAQSPAIDDEFAKDVSEFETLEAFKKDLGDKLLDRRAHQADHAFEDGVMAELIGVLEVELPEKMVEHRANQVLEDYAARFTNQGIKFEDYIRMTGQSLDDLKEQSRAAALHQIKSELALDAVAEAEKFEITDEELQTEFEALAKQYNMTADDVKAVAPAEDVKTTLMRRKAMALVKESAKATKAKKTSAKKEAAPAEESEEKPKKKAAAKKDTAPAEEGEEKPKKKAAPKKKAETKTEE
ncbi:MAG: trigger factor [Clostridia bacterium]|nr:trigger factor [Clostridia bacterium]